jgi:hypothetical protein
MFLSPWLRKSIVLLVVSIVFGLLVREVVCNWDELEHVVKGDKINALALYGLLLVFFFGLLANAWRLLMLAHTQHCNWKEVAYVFFAPNPGKYLPGKILYLVGRVELTQKITGSRKTAISCFTAEQVYLMLGAALISFPAAIRATTAYEPTILISVLSILALGLVLVMAGSRMISSLITLLGKLGTIPSNLNFSPALFKVLVANYGLAWTVYALAGYLLADRIFGVDYQDSIYVASAFVLAWLGGFVSVFTPSGIGVREGILAALLIPVIGTGQASLLAIVGRVLWTCIELGLSGLAILWQPDFSKENIGP